MYSSYHLGRALTAPLNTWAGALRALWSHPAFPVTSTPFGRAVAGASELLERITRRYSKPPFGIAQALIGGRIVAVREVPVLRTPFCDLIRFERDVSRQDPKVLLVAPLSGHHASLLRDTVERLQRFIHSIGSDVHVIAVCQPSVPALAAIALMAEEGDPATPLSMTLMAGPVDTRVNPTRVDCLATGRPLSWFELTAIHRVPAWEPGFLRRVYPGFLQLTAFVSLNPGRHADAHRKLYRDLLAGDEESAEAHRRFYDDYLAVMDVPGEYYLQTIASVFQRHELARGEMTCRGKPVRPEAITRTALLTVEAENDDITSVGQTAAAHALCSKLPAKRKSRHVQPGAGHYGVFSGRRWREEIAPRIAGFIRKHG